MTLAGRLLLVVLAVPLIFFVHLFGIFFVGALLSNYEAAFEWPILGTALFSFIATTSLVFALIFRDKP